MNGQLSLHASTHITGLEVPDIALASFRYNGTVIKLIPAEMERDESGFFVKELDGLHITLELHSYPTEYAAEWLMRITNKSEHNSGRINEFCGMDVTLPCSEAEYGSLSGDYCGADSFMHFTKRLYQGDYTARCAVNGRSSAQSAFPYYDICEGGDSSLICAIGWTGQWKSEITLSYGALNMKASVADADFYLLPGESVRAPRMLIMSGDCAPDALRRRFVSLEREYYSPKRLGGNSDFSRIRAVQCFDRYYWTDPTWPGEEPQMKLAKAIIDLETANTYWFDAAWFEGYFLRGVGNYRYNSLLPRGMKPIADKLHENGMNCLLWFEPESIQNPLANEPDYGKTTDFFLEHPEWMLTKTDGPKEKQPLFLADLTNPDARDYIFEKISGIIKENHLAVYRQDFNQEPLIYWRHADEPGRSGITELHYIEGLYELWDRLLARFPSLVIDNCSSGGRRLDFEMLSRSVSLWKSDVACGPATEETPREVWDQNMTRTLGRYLPYYTSASWYSEAYYARSVATRSLVLQVPLTDADFDPTATRAAFAETARTARYFDGDMYELTAPSLAFDEWAGYQCHLDESGEGMLRLFRRRDCAEPTFKPQLHGIEPDALYEIDIWNERYEKTALELEGSALADYAFEIAQPKASLTVEYRKK